MKTIKLRNKRNNLGQNCSKLSLVSQSDMGESMKAMFGEALIQMFWEINYSEWLGVGGNKVIIRLTQSSGAGAGAELGNKSFLAGQFYTFH